MNQLMLDAALETVHQQVRVTIAEFHVSMQKAEKRAGSMLAQGVKESAVQMQWGLQNDLHVAESAGGLAREFGITFLDGWAIEPNSHDTGTGRLGFIVFSRANRQLVEHPVTRGIDRVMSFTGQAMLFPESGTPFLKLSQEARVAPYRDRKFPAWIIEQNVRL